MKSGLDPAFEQAALPRTDVIPFESEHRFMASLHHDDAGRGVVLLKGAPERVLGLCTLQRGAAGDVPLHRDDWVVRMEDAASSGMRLIALASRAADDHGRELTLAGVEAGGFTLLGVAGITDPPREEARRAVADCHAAGIRVVMITGDHASTAMAIGRQLGLGQDVPAVGGAALDGMDEATLRDVAANTDVFARASPEHKLRLVQALQAQGHVVAMTGDGVNDAPALKRADVGIAMGCKGTEAAKEAAEIVLADDNFATIVAAVEEGRTAYGNIRKAILFLLPANAGQAGMIMLAVLAGMTLPVTPVQILWVNMVTAVTLALALAFERTEAGTMQQPPRDPKEPLMSRYLAWRLALVSGLMIAGSLGLFLYEMRQGASLEAARCAAVNTLVAGEIGYLFNCRRISASCLDIAGMLGNRYALAAVAVLVVLQLLFTYLPAMQAWFGTAGLAPAAWSRIALFGVVLLLAVEADKWGFRHRRRTA
jgi:magnesium-transporting ATPase (P-type)